MAKSKFVASYAGIGELLVSDMIRDDMKRRADRVMEAAISISPAASKRKRAEGERHYIDCFEVSTGTQNRGGGPRAYARVTNTSDHAVAVEYGWGGTPKYRVLGKALNAAGG